LAIAAGVKMSGADLGCTSVGAVVTGVVDIFSPDIRI
jgi:hypothetical protein